MIGTIFRCDDCVHVEACARTCAIFRVYYAEFIRHSDGCRAYKRKADFAEVVRCKDCKHWIKADDGRSWQMIGRTDGTCKHLISIHYAERYMTEGDHFCAYGEKREGE